MLANVRRDMLINLTENSVQFIKIRTFNGVCSGLVVFEAITVLSSQVVQPFFTLGPISEVLYRRAPEDEVFVNIFPNGVVVHHLFELPLITWFTPNID